MKLNFFFILFILIFIFKIFYFFLIQNNGDFLVADSNSYLNIANGIFVNNNFILSTSRTFVYPLFIKIIFILFEENIIFVLFAQLILSLLTCLLIFKISIKFFDKEIYRFILLFVYGIEPITNIFVFKLSTEILFTFFLILLLFFFIKFIESKTHKSKIFFLTISYLLLFLLPNTVNCYVLYIIIMIFTVVSYIIILILKF